MAQVEAPGSESIEIKVPCRAEYVRTVRRAVADFAALRNMPRSAVEEVEVAASEAVSNIIRHAYEGWACVPPVLVKCVYCADELTVEVIDKGKGFNAPSDGVIPDVDLSKDGGLGIILIKTLMDRVKFTSKPDAGTRIRMMKSARVTLTKAVRGHPQQFPVVTGVSNH